MRFSSEADSLNFSVLGVDVAPGSAEFDLYVRQLVTEMTAKAGQKCTAIRRALVPDALVPDVIDAVQARIADKVRVGDPTADGVTMGALVGLAQRDDVRKNLAELAGAAKVVIGDPDHFDVIGADPERGAFLPPVLLWAKDSSRDEPHDIEVFGPVSTVLGYRDTDHAIELAARGRGSLVGSLVSADPAGCPRTGPGCRTVARPGAWSWTRTPRPNRPVTAPRCRTWCTAVPAAPATGRSSAASAASCTTCSAPRSRVRRLRCPQSRAPG